MEISTLMYITVMTSSLLGIILSIISLVLSFLALSKAVGAEKSTHSVQLMPIDPEIDAHNEKMLSGWATSQAAVDKQTKLFRKDLEKEMPEFSLDDDDKEIFSL